MNATIKQYIAAGLSVIPVKVDKRPLIDWKAYQTARATEQQAEGWKLPIALVCGAVSGGLTCIDFDDKGSAFEEWRNRVKEICPDVLEDVCIQRTPSGGWHVVFRSGFKIENRKLAQRAAREGEEAKIKVLIETRGEGGYFLVYPSAGYCREIGDVTALLPIPEDVAENLVMIGESFNEVADVRQEAIPPSQPVARGLSPFDEYDAKHTPVDLLLAHGWTTIGGSGDKTLFCRPGKKGGVSATWNHVPNRFYVFSTSTEFEAQHVYKASAVYAILEHRGDFIAAAKALYQHGHGQRPTARPVDVDTTPVTATVKMSAVKEQIYAFYKGERKKGLRLELKKFDELLRWGHGHLNVITGIPTHGKSEFLDFLMVKLSMLHQWNFVVFSPENYPLEIHFNKIAEKFHRGSLHGAESHIIQEAIDWCDEHFSFINATEEELTLDTILSACLDLKQHGRVDSLVIDPWNEIEHASRPKDVNESEFTGSCLRRLRKFARKNELAIFVVVHPAKMYRNKESEKYPVPTLYDPAGSAHWYNKSDNALVVYRDFEKDTTEVYVKKVKYRNYGTLGMVQFTFDKESGYYEELTEAAKEKRDFCG